MKKIFYVFITSAILFSCNTTPKTETEETSESTSSTNETATPETTTTMQKTDYIYAHIKTNKGEIVCDLEFEKTPITAANFIGLSEGTIPNKVKPAGKPFYDGLTFHRVEQNFMIQGGDPKGNGTGDPGYSFQDEFDPSLTFTGPGILAMANSGPATNGSQFFITHVKTEWLDGKHTIFGHVTKGQDIVNKIAVGDKIESITIERVGEKAKAFDAKAIFTYALAHPKKSPFEEWIATNYPNAKKVDGIYIDITKKGTGAIPKPGQMVAAHYTGKFKDGKKFDSSLDHGKPLEFKVGAGQVIPGWDIGFTKIPVGTKATFIIPYLYAYGEQGYPGAIPPKSDLVFDVELLNAK